jgi:hypothetical protein
MGVFLTRRRRGDKNEDLPPNTNEAEALDMTNLLIGRPDSSRRPSRPRRLASIFLNQSSHLLNQVLGVKLADIICWLSQRQK